MEPVDQAPRDADGNAELKRIMTVLLPDLHKIFDRIGARVLETGDSDEHSTTQLAADYRFWYDKSMKELVRHYNTYELSPTVVERQKEDPNAATNSAHNITRLNVGEAVGEYLAARPKEFTPTKALQFRRALYRIQELSEKLDTTGVESLENRRRDTTIKGS